MSHEKKVEPVLQRYKRSERINHWIVAGCFLMLTCSGLAFFYPAFFWLTGIFGTPQLARIVHPIVGIVMFVGFFIQFFRYVRYNFMDKEDIKWMLSIRQVLKGEEVGEADKYNAGQKGMFWLMTACMLVLLVTGVLSWHTYFGQIVPIPIKRLALMFHAGAALTLIAGIIVHVYAAIWVQGTIRAMVEGVVSQAWARTHHPRWYRRMMAQAQEQQAKEQETQTESL